MSRGQWELEGVFSRVLTGTNGVLSATAKYALQASGVRRKFPRGGPKHRRSQGRAKGAMPPPNLWKI